MTRFVAFVTGASGGLGGALIGFHLTHIDTMAWQIAWGLSSWAPYFDPRSMLLDLLRSVCLGVAAASVVGLCSSRWSPRRVFWIGLISGIVANLIFASLGVEHRVRE
jgi:hypothetical protein